MHRCSALYISQFIHPRGCWGARSPSSHWACQQGFVRLCLHPHSAGAEDKVSQVSHTSSRFEPILLWTCTFLVEEKGFGPTLGAAVQRLSLGFSLLFRNLASAIDRVLIFPFHDYLTTCLFTLVIISKGQGLETTLSENTIRVEMSLATAQVQPEQRKISLYLVELVLLKWMLRPFLSALRPQLMIWVVLWVFCGALGLNGPLWVLGKVRGWVNGIAERKWQMDQCWVGKRPWTHFQADRKIQRKWREGRWVSEPYVKKQKNPENF